MKHRSFTFQKHLPADSYSLGIKRKLFYWHVLCDLVPILCLSQVDGFCLNIGLIPRAVKY